MILRVFWGRLIRMVGPRAAATATPAVVVTNSRRSMVLRLVIEMPSNELKDAVSGVRTPGHPTPDTKHLPLQRVQHAEGDLLGVRRAGVVPDHGPVVLEAERVAARAEAQQDVSLVALLAGETTDHRRMVLCELARVGLVQTVVPPQAPVRREVVAGLGPSAPAADVSFRRSGLRDVCEQLSDRLAVVHVPVQREVARVDAAASLDPPCRQVGVFCTRVGRVATGPGRVLPIDVTDDVEAPAKVLTLFREVEPRLELRQPGGLAVSDVVGCR